jgi:hypothetical protein
MALTIQRKFRIKEGDVLYVINPPSGFIESWGDLPHGITIRKTADACHQVQWFVKDHETLAAGMDKALPWIRKEVTCWICFPKGTSGVQTDLTRDKGWEKLQEAGLCWKRLVSFNNTWSAFAVGQGETAVKETKERRVFQYIDAAAKTVRLPEDFALQLNNSPRAKAAFGSLSFTNKKGYVEWIVNAKRTGTRLLRLQASVERLAMGWKNPANR